jgi:hypothetical protein
MATINRMGDLELVPCTPSDTSDILDGEIAAFSNPYEPFFFVLFPESESKARAMERIQDSWPRDETERWMKVVDTKTSKF